MSWRPHRLAVAALCALTAILAAGASTGALAAGPEGALDARAWEMVSPAEKNGGEVEIPGAPNGGLLRAAAAGGALAFGSRTSFGIAAGAAPVSQYVSGRGGDGWGTVNLTPPLLSGTYEGGAYQLFSGGLERAILTSGWRCRDGGEACAGENPTLGAGAPTGYRNLYLRDAGGTFRPLITTANSPALSVPAADFDFALAGASSDLAHAVVSTCAALTAAAVEVPAGSGCDPQGQNLYLWSSSGTLQAVNLAPGETSSAPGATLAAPAGAVSATGERAYWKGVDGNLYLRDGGTTVQVDEAAGGGGEFQVASTDGRVAYFTAGGHLYRFQVGGGPAADLTPAGGTLGVLGASADGSLLYYLTGAGLHLHRAGGSSKIAASADLANTPPATGSARVSADGGQLAFVSSASLTGYPNGGKTEVFLYRATSNALTCVSCNPRGTPPAGPSSIPGALAAGGGPPAYKPRVLSEQGSGARVFFDSVDALVTQDTNRAPDVYEWESPGTGSCERVGGCVALVSGGRGGSATFLDASADGADAFFLTDVSLLPRDPGSLDVYTARAGGGFPEPQPPIPCNGDECQGPPPAPEGQVPGTSILVGPSNPPLRFKPRKCRSARGKKGGSRGKCARKRSARKCRAGKGGRHGKGGERGRKCHRKKGNGVRR